MRTCDLKEVTGKALKEWYEWLVRKQAGCCSVHFASTEKYRYCVCVGWHTVDVDDGPGEPVKVGKTTLYAHKSHEEQRIYWKIGRQTHDNIMQCDYDIDFEMPYVTEAMARSDPELVEGDVDDTNEDIVPKWSKVVTKGRNGHIESMRLGAPVGYRSWEDLAKYVRKIARRVWRDWRDYDD